LHANIYILAGLYTLIFWRNKSRFNTHEHIRVSSLILIRILFLREVLKIFEATYKVAHSFWWLSIYYYGDFFVSYLKSVFSSSFAFFGTFCVIYGVCGNKITAFLSVKNFCLNRITFTILKIKFFAISFFYMPIHVVIDPPCWLLIFLRGLAILGYAVRIRSRFFITLCLLVELRETALVKLVTT